MTYGGVGGGGRTEGILRQEQCLYPRACFERSQARKSPGKYLIVSSRTSSEWAVP
jgi:hypothetical protein